MTERQVLERIKELKQSVKIVESLTEEEIQAQNDRKKRWMTLWRNNPNLYIHYVLGIKMFPFEHHSLYEMGQSTTYDEVSTRGTAKTFRAITYGTSQCMLRPYCQVGIGAVTRDQAGDDYREKFIKELVNKSNMSPVISYLYEIGMITSKEIDKGYLVIFWNGSTMIFFPMIPSSRGLRLNLLILEECRLMKKSDIDSIGIPMLFPRQPEFRSLPQYIEDRSYDEPEQTIYITSNRFKSEWFNKTFNDTFVDYFRDKINKNRVFCVDIFVAIKRGLKTKGWFFKQKNGGMNELDFRMEVLNETIGEAEGAYFTWEQFRKNQVIKNAFVPPTSEEVRNGTLKNRQKENGEIRLIFIDFSFSGSHGNTVNDNTAIGCMSLIPKEDTLYRSVEYLETHSGSDNEDSLLRIRELFWDYQADYIVVDLLNGGTVNFDQLTKVQFHPQRDIDIWNPHGFRLVENSALHMIGEAKQKELESRIIDPQAVPCIIPVEANSNWNSNMWQSLALKLKNEQISFLVDEVEYDSNIANDKDWFKWTSEDRARRKLPYVSTMFMINEAVNLTKEWREGKLFLHEPRSGTKDSIVAMAYANAIADKIENDLQKKSQVDEEYDIDDLQLVF